MIMPYKDPQKYKEYQKEYRMRPENIERKREVGIKYRQENREVLSKKNKEKWQSRTDEQKLIDYEKGKKYRDNNAKEISSRRKKKWTDRTIEEVEARKKYAKKWREDNKEHLRNQRLIKEFGIDMNDYNLLLESQNYRCAICKSTETGRKDTEHFSVDHCHKTGKVRGLLCKSCNIMLGEAKDDCNILSKAINYLNEGLGNI